MTETAPDATGVEAPASTASTIWNGMIERRPALIARCARPGDVAAAVRFNRES